MSASTNPVRCWCGNVQLTAFSPEFLRCDACGTLVVRSPPTDPTTVADEGASLYGLNYFTDHAHALGHPGLAERARLDLGERCAFWLRSLLRRRPPPARVLELGCANGAFVGLLTAAGYEATGLDLSPAVTAFVRESFQVPVVTGPLETQDFASASFDVIVLMDVLEHLPDPLGTLRIARRLLTEDGVLLVQTPRFEPERSYEELRAARAPFLEHLKHHEHLLLFSPAAAARLASAAGFSDLAFEPAIFAVYDMFFAASPRRLPEVPEEAWRAALRSSRTGRIVEALVDAELAARRREARVADLEADRAARLEVIEQQQIALARVEADRAEAAAERTRLDALAREHAALLRRLGPLASLLQRGIART